MNALSRLARPGLLLALPVSLSLLTACGGGEGIGATPDAGAIPAPTTLSATIGPEVADLPDAVDKAQEDADVTVASSVALQPEVVAKAFSLQDPISSTYASAVTIGEALAKVNAVRGVGRMCGTTWYPAAAPLVWNEALARAASAHSLDMATRNYFSHTSLDGRTFVQRIEAQGYTGWRALAENISAGRSTMDATVASWLQSSGHCRNMMNPRYKEYGIGLAYKSGSRYGTYWTQTFGARW